MWIKRPNQAVRAYALVQVASCFYYGFYEDLASESDYRIGYTFFTVIATTLAGWEVVKSYTSRISRLIGFLSGAGFLMAVLRVLPSANIDTRLVLVQASGATAIWVAFGLSLPWNSKKLVPATLGILFFGIALFWFGVSFKPEWKSNWDWIMPVWMHTAAYSWLGWKLKWVMRTV